MLRSIAHRLRRAYLHSYLRLRRCAVARRGWFPAPARLLIRRVERVFDPLAIWLYRRRTGEERPIPPRGLRERNAVDSVSFWFSSAEQAEGPLHEMLASVDRHIEDFDRALDFGCGAGKVIAAVRGRGVELHGCDIHEPSIRWLERWFPDLHVVANPFDPPLIYPDDHFDLLWAWSVLTHIDGDRQRAWIGEWARIVRPGGLVLATFHGPLQVDNFRRRGAALPKGLVGTVEREGVAFVPARIDGNFSADFTGTTLPYGDTFNTSDNIRTRLREAGFEVVDIAERSHWGNQHCAIAQLPAPSPATLA
ncbi:MAG: class I SAM-dependent methyltransferase [Thermoleophilaceae bacterium]